MILLSRKFLDQHDGIPSALLISRLLALHKEQLVRLTKLWNYYEGEQAITKRTMADNIPNNRLVSNHAQYITDMAVGYVLGEPIQYSSDDEQALEALLDLYTRQDEDSHNAELGDDISIFGHGLELLTMSDSDASEPTLSVLSPLEAFVVCDTTVERKPYMAVKYSKRQNLDGTDDGYDIDIWTESRQFYFWASDLASLEKGDIRDADQRDHYFGGVPVIEYQNNRTETGDFEPVLSLIDAYNLLMSDRVNDKEAFVDSILVVAGMTLGDDTSEAAATVKKLRELRYIEIPEDGHAEWLSKTLSESDTEILKKAIKDDIHEFSKVPCLTDENFAANASGVAMKYKLLAFEQLAAVKERYFKRGLRQRFALMDNAYSIQGKQTDFSAIDITMKRTLPVDEQMQATIAQMTDGFVSWETRLAAYNPELDPDTERERLLEEKKEAAEIQQAAFGGYALPLPTEPDDDEGEAEDLKAKQTPKESEKG